MKGAIVFIRSVIRGADQRLARSSNPVTLPIMNAHDLITVDPNILGGVPVFKGTRVPVKTLFEYLENNYSLDEFLECFPSVTREMACILLDRSRDAVLVEAA